MRKTRLPALLLAALFMAASLITGCASAKPTAAKKDAPAEYAPKPAAPQQPSYPAPATPPPRPYAPVPPNPPQDMYFQDVGENPHVSTARQPTSTFAIDVDTASYTVARNYLNRNMIPPAEGIRIEEFVNYFPQYYPASDKPVSVYIEGAPSPYRAGWHLLQIGIQARDVTRSERKPAVLTFVVDTSGSMSQENRLGLVKQSLNILLDQLRPEDKVGIVIYGSEAQVWLEHTNNKQVIRREIDRLSTSGATNAEAGLTLGYDLAHRAFREGGTNRVILCSDGVANVGNTGPDAMLRRIEDYKARGITLTTVGFGMGNYNDALMERLADKGDGHYSYVDTLEEARKVFVDQLTGTLELIAKDTKVQVQFDPGVVTAYRLVGYENRNMKNEDFRNDKADGGEMGAGHSVTALYEVQIDDRSGDRELGRVFVRYKEPNSGEAIETNAPVTRKALAPSLASASPRLRWSAAVAEFAGILSRSPLSLETRLATVMETAQRAATDLGMPGPHKECLDLMERAYRLRAGW